MNIKSDFLQAKIASLTFRAVYGKSRSRTYVHIVPAAVDIRKVQQALGLQWSVPVLKGNLHRLLGEAKQGRNQIHLGFTCLHSLDAKILIMLINLTYF